MEIGQPTAHRGRLHPKQRYPLRRYGPPPTHHSLAYPKHFDRCLLLDVEMIPAKCRHTLFVAYSIQPVTRRPGTPIGQRPAFHPKHATRGGGRMQARLDPQGPDLPPQRPFALGGDRGPKHRRPPDNQPRFARLKHGQRNGRAADSDTLPSRSPWLRRRSDEGSTQAGPAPPARMPSARIKRGARMH